jgi:hypothetical protein
VAAARTREGKQRVDRDSPRSTCTARARS